MKKKKKLKDATGSPHNLNDAKKRGTAKAVPKPPITKQHAPMDDRKPNDFGRSGNDADRELETMRGMDKTKQMYMRKGKKKK